MKCALVLLATFLCLGLGSATPVPDLFIHPKSGVQDIQPNKNTIRVVCKVPHGKCRIKCWSGDDIIGPLDYEIGEEMTFSFTGLAWTKFWCEAWWGETAYVTHPAFDAGAPRQSNHFELDNYGSNLLNWQTNLAWRWQGVAPPPPEN